MDVPTARWLADWSDQQKTRLSADPLAGYANGEKAAAEPVAFSAITACAFGLKEPAEVACRRLLGAQQANGSVSVGLDDQGPFWTTSLAALAWRQFERSWPEDKSSSSSSSAGQYRDAYRRAIDFLTSYGGGKTDPSETFGHDTQLVGWPWVNGTHSWLEPTAMALLAMRQCGYAKHPRAIEAAELLLDRQIDTGGANYGNTYVLGQRLRPHVMPSAMSLVALHRFKPRPRSLKATIAYLRSEIKQPVASISLAWAIHALASDAIERIDEGKPAAESDLDFMVPLQAAIDRKRVIGESPHRQNLLMLASLGAKSPLLDLAYHSLPKQRQSLPKQQQANR